MFRDSLACASWSLMSMSAYCSEQRNLCGRANVPLELAMYADRRNNIATTARHLKRRRPQIQTADAVLSVHIPIGDRSSSLTWLAGSVGAAARYGGLAKSGPFARLAS